MCRVVGWSLLLGKERGRECCRILDPYRLGQARSGAKGFLLSPFFFPIRSRCAVYRVASLKKGKKDPSIHLHCVSASFFTSTPMDGHIESQNFSRGELWIRCAGLRNVMKTFRKGFCFLLCIHTSALGILEDGERGGNEKQNPTEGPLPSFCPRPLDFGLATLFQEVKRGPKERKTGGKKKGRKSFLSWAVCPSSTWKKGLDLRVSLYGPYREKKGKDRGRRGGRSTIERRRCASPGDVKDPPHMIGYPSLSLCLSCVNVLNDNAFTSFASQSDAPPPDDPRASQIPLGAPGSWRSFHVMVPGRS